MDNTATILPIEYLLEIVLEEILYHGVAIFRRINRKFNNICTNLLNKGYKSAKLHTIRHQDVLTTIERRLSILDETFLRYISLNLCCFIPGKVIDSMLSIFQTIQKERKSKRNNSESECLNAYKALQKYVDISSKAIKAL